MSDLKRLITATLDRAYSPNGFGHKRNAWSKSDWLLALVGETGEAANVLKKIKRLKDGVAGNSDSDTIDKLNIDLAEELADIFTYLIIVSDRCGVDLESAFIEKFNKVSQRIGYEDELLEKDDWYHVTEKLPPKGVEVLVTSSNFSDDDFFDPMLGDWFGEWNDIKTGIVIETAEDDFFVAEYWRFLPSMPNSKAHDLPAKVYKEDRPERVFWPVS